MTARYDMAGRIVEREHKDLTDGLTHGVRYVWHGAFLAEIDDDAQHTEYTHDQYGHRTCERITYKATPNAGATSYTTVYHYDQLGRLNQVKLPEGAMLTYRFDAISRVVQVDYQPPALIGGEVLPLISNLETDSAHGLLGFTHSNGEQATARYDPALRLVGWQDGIAHTQLKYNADGDISQLVRNRQILGLDYNLQGRLAKVVEGNQTEHFDLDTNGNRLSQTPLSGQTETYKYRHASDQLLAAGSQSYRYNSVGEPVQIEAGTETRHLNYGPMGELDSISTQQADKKPSIAIYRYNQDLQRIAKTANGQTTFFLWQGGRISAEADAQGHIRTRYLYLGDRPVEVIKYNTRGQPHIYAVLTDHIGAPLAVADGHKNIVWQAQYSIYGRATVRDHCLHSGASPPTNAILRIFGIADAQANIPSAHFQFNLRLPGQYEDTETDYYYNFHRYYDPSTGRYLTPDPIGLEGGTNLYGYVDGNPAGATDAWGLAQPIGNFNEVTKYIYQEMMNNFSSAQVQFIKNALSNTLTSPYAYAAWYNLVKMGGKWDHKFAINNRLTRTTQTPFWGVRSSWFAHYPPEDGISCPAPDSWYSYDIWSNIHYGFIGLEAGFNSEVLLDAAGMAQIDGRTSQFIKLVLNGGLSGMRRFDDAKDQSAIQLGFSLYHKYGNKFSLTQFRDEVVAWKGLQVRMTAPK